MSFKGVFIGALITVAMISGIVTFCRNVLWPLPTDEISLPATCGVGAPHSSLAASHNPTLKKLAEYELLCKGAAVDSLMHFTAMPTSDNEATTLAASTAETLKELSDYAITPLVVFEPSLTSKTIINDISQGMYDTVLAKYFAALKNNGVTDTQMGTWVLFPEANTPTWHNTNPNEFITNVKKVTKFQKESFPSSKTSILLNSWTYESDDISWSRGELKSLAPYVEALKDKVDSFGLQGFPYKAPVNEPLNDRLHTKDFLPANLAKETAEKLNTRNVWLNSGTFSRMHTDNPANEVRLSADERGKILSEILSEAISLQKDFTVQINIFAQNKAPLAEHVDWSYWQSPGVPSGQDATTLEHFLRQIRANKLRFSLYDTVQN